METFKTIIGAGYAAKKSIVTTIYPAKKTTIGGSYTPFVTVINTVVQVSGQMSATGSISFTGTASLKATGLINASANISISGAAGILGTTFITASSSISISANANIIGVGLMVASASASIAGEATLTGSSPAEGEMTGNAAISITGQATLIAVGLMIPAANISITGTAGLIGTGYMTATASISVTGSAALQSVGLMVATASVSISGSATLQATGLMLATSSMSITGSATLTAAGGYHALTEPAMDAKGIPDDATVYYSGTAEEITGHEMWLVFDDMISAMDTAGILAKFASYHNASGGNEQGHEVNVLDPGTFDRTWHVNGTGAVVTHDKFGWTHSGTSNSDGSYGKNGVIPSTHNIRGIAFKTRSTSERVNAIALGAWGADPKEIRFIVKDTGVDAYYSVGGALNDTSNFTSCAGTHATGREDASTTHYYNEGVLVNTFSSDNENGYPTYELYDGAFNFQGGPSNFSSLNFTHIAWLTDDLTAQEHEDLKDIWNAFEIAMNR